jgi:hypothetical protein
VKKYLVIDNKGKRELSEEEYTDFFFSNLSNHFYKNIENTYQNLKTTKTFDNYRKYFSKRPKTIKKCQIQDCNELPIYSHSISKKAILENISSKGLVYSLIVKKDRVVMGTVGIEKQASVFPCFCNTHDSRHFSELDKTQGQDYSEKFFQQLIDRTILREFYVLQRNLEMAEIVIKEIDSGFDNIKNETINQFNDQLNSGRIVVKDWSDSRFSLSENKKEIQDQIIYDKSCLQKLSDFYLIQKPNRVTSAILDSNLPVAFSGLTKFYLDNSEINIVINCLPYKDHTILSLVNTEKDDEIIKTELLSKYDLDDINSLLKLIEVLAVYGTDNIFFDINYWDSLDDNICQKYIQEFSNFEGTDPRNGIDFSFLKWDYK